MPALMCILAVLVSLLITVNKRAARSNERCSLAAACKVLAYLEGFKDSEGNVLNMESTYWFTEYYDYLCNIGMLDCDMFPDGGTDRALLQSDIDYIYRYLNIAHEPATQDNRAVSNTEFLKIVNEYKSHFRRGADMMELQLGIVATGSEADSTEDVFNSPYTVSTNKGRFNHTGLNLTGFKDSTIAALCMDDEILMITGMVTEQTTFKNVWISGFRDNTLYVNMYGVDRKFIIGGTSEDVSGMIADIVLENGRLIGITVKRNITDTNVRILLYNSKSSSVEHENVTVTSDYPFFMTRGDVVTEYSADETVTLTGEDESINSTDRLNNAGRSVTFTSSSNGQLKLLSVEKSQGNPSYEGSLTVYGTGSGVVVVNEVAIEKYLKRVVPSEMPASYGVEALKVQAVCARSYAYAHLDGYAYPEYQAHMDDTINYQVYNNTVEKPEANEAISATTGKMLYYGDEIVNAYYYSTSCGSGTDVSLWGSSPTGYPYYVSRIISANEKTKDLSDEGEFRRFITATDEQDYDYGADYYRWKIQLSASDIAKNLISAGYSDIGTVKNVSVTNRVSGGAVNGVTIQGSKADITLESEGQIRKILELPSSFFITDSSGKSSDKTYTFTGGGYGHGIGMSQHAVKAMAQKGMDYISILNFFYVGTSIF